MKTVSEQMELARKAQAIVNDYTQEQIDEICLAIGWEVYEDENIAKLAKMAVEETGYGNVQSKIIKHKRKVGGVLHDIKGAKSVGLIERNEETGISKYAKPVGVVCAILPATNPTATCGGKAVGILKGRNAVIFKPSSRALKSTTEAINMMRAGLRKVGAPEDLIQVLEDPSREAITELMKGLRSHRRHRQRAGRAGRLLQRHPGLRRRAGQRLRHRSRRRRRRRSRQDDLRQQAVRLRHILLVRKRGHPG